MNHWGRGRYRGYSAGSQPAGRVNPYALEVLERNNIAILEPRSKSWSEFNEAQAPHMDFVFTVCDSAASEVCPIWPGQPMTAHWGIADPAAVDGSDLDKINAFRKAFRELETRIKLFSSLPMERLDKMRIQTEIDAIGRGANPK